MADIPLIIALIWVFYLAECLAWSGKGVAHFRYLWGLGWRVSRPSELAGGARGGILLRFPFPPLGILAPAPPPLVAFSPEGLARYVPEHEGAAPGGGSGHHFYNDIGAVDVKDRDLLINGRLFVRALSKPAAQELAGSIGRIKRARAADRERLIRKRVRGMFDRSAIEGRVGRFREETSLLSVLCNFLWLYLMVGIPGFLVIYGFSRVILPYLGIVLILHLLISAETLRAHRALYGRRDLSLLGTLLPSPFNSIRAMDILAKELLSGYHPFAVSMALLSRERSIGYARHELARILHPIYGAGLAEEDRRIDRWYKGLLVSSMEDALGERGIDPAGLLVPEPDRSDGAFLSYCPRCLCLYRQESGSCPDCPGVELTPWRGRVP